MNVDDGRIMRSWRSCLLLTYKTYNMCNDEQLSIFRDDSITKNIGRILKIWRERKVFPKDFLAEITELYGLIQI